MMMPNVDDCPHSVLVSGAEATFEWIEEAERLLGLALVWLARHDQQPHIYEVSVSLVDDETIRDLNRRYRGHDAPTDVLSFGQLEGDGLPASTYPADVPIPLGDIVVSMAKVREQAAAYGHGPAREFGYLLAHGFLHLCGYDHQSADEAAAMRVAEEEVLAEAGLTRDNERR